MSRELIAFEARHLLGIEIQPGQRDEVMVGSIEGTAQWIEAQNYPSFTGLRGGEVIAAAGLVPSGSGVGTGWMFLPNCADRHDMLWVMRQSKRLLNTVQRDAKYLSVQITVRKGWKAAERFAGMLGFTATDVVVCPEGVKHMYTVYERF